MQPKIITMACSNGKHEICIGWPGGFCRCECHEENPETKEAPHVNE